MQLVSEEQWPASVFGMAEITCSHTRTAAYHEEAYVHTYAGVSRCRLW